MLIARPATSGSISRRRIEAENRGRVLYGFLVRGHCYVPGGILLSGKIPAPDRIHSGRIRGLIATSHVRLLL